jgi:hypothetical protein
LKLFSVWDVYARHCEERSDEAIQSGFRGLLDCFASLAMTVRASNSSLPGLTRQSIFFEK